MLHGSIEPFSPVEVFPRDMKRIFINQPTAMPTHAGVAIWQRLCSGLKDRTLSGRTTE
jgi:hypothetical protein